MRKTISAAFLIGLFALLPASLAAAAPLTDEAKRAVVSQAAAALAEIYVYPDVGRRAGDSIRKTLDAGGYAEITDTDAFASRLTADLQAVTHDKHMRVVEPNRPRPAGGPPPLMTKAGFIRVERLKGNIGYIALAGFPNPAMFRDAADSAMRAVQGTDALIIDMRRNGGGSPAAVGYLCSFFFDPSSPTHLNNLIWRQRGTETFETEAFYTVAVPTHYLGKPVILITGPRTFSGGEEFTNNLKVLKRARIVGETTGGGANPGGTQPIGSGLFLFVPDGRAENPVTKTSWEGVGVAPDVPTAPEEAFVAAYRIALDAAPASPSRRDLRKSLTPVASGEAEAWTEAALQTLATEPAPRREAALRGIIEALGQGAPDYKTMSPEAVEGMKRDLPRLRSALAAKGPLQSLSFKRVDRLGADVYQATFANGVMDWVIYVTAQGQIAAVFSPTLGPPDAPPTPARATSSAAAGSSPAP